LKTPGNKIKTSIWFEESGDDNPFYALRSYCHGYDFYNALLGGVGFTELIFLHLKGELPDQKTNEHFNLLLASVMNPGPRHLQNRAAMSAAIGGCPVGGALISGFACSMGAMEGGLAVEAVMTMLLEIKRQTGEKGPADLKDISEKYSDKGNLPGFGLLNAGDDIQARRLAEILRERRWNGFFVDLLLRIESLAEAAGMPGVRLYGVFGASLLDLGFSPVQGHGLFMLSGGVGMLGFLCERYGEKWYEYPTWFSEGVYNYEKGRTGENG
jgi:citrate synthase